MIRVRGFKGRYFTLAAIQAYSSAASLHARHDSFVSSDPFCSVRTDDEEDPPPEEPFAVFSSIRGSVPESSKPCHCNCHFRRIAWLLFHLSKFFRRTLCRCRKTKTGLAPPPPLFSKQSVKARCAHAYQP